MLKEAQIISVTQWTGFWFTCPDSAFLSFKDIFGNLAFILIWLLFLFFHRDRGEWQERDWRSWAAAVRPQPSWLNVLYKILVRSTDSTFRSLCWPAASTAEPCWAKPCNPLMLLYLVYNEAFDFQTQEASKDLTFLFYSSLKKKLKYWQTH